MARSKKIKIQKAMGLLLLVATASMLVALWKFFGKEADGSFAIITIPLGVALLFSKRCWLSI